MEPNNREPCGVLLLHKPLGMTSHDCVNRVRRLYNTKKVGHTGTLDPMAQGLLPILVGRAAKAADFAQAGKKHYIATLCLGMTTDTEDTTGKVLSRSDRIPPDGAVVDTIATFVGEIMQVPPMYSALKVNGKKLVDLARKGSEIERQPRPITIFQCNAEKCGAQEWQLDVICSKGTYIRTLCSDIGKKLGCGGAMGSLLRTETGGFVLEESVSLEQLEGMALSQRIALLRPVESLFYDAPQLQLPTFYNGLAKNGNEIYLSKLKKETLPPLSPGDYVRLCDEGGFWALGQVRLFPPSEKSGSEVDSPAILPVKRFVL